MRKLLAVVNAIFLALWFYNTAFNMPSLRLDAWQYVVAWTVVVMFAANAVLLWTAATGTSKSRLGRMLGYWLDAKEAELKARADGNSPR